MGYISTYISTKIIPLKMVYVKQKKYTNLLKIDTKK